MSGSLHVVVVNWNTGGWLRACLESLAVGREGAELERVTVVDNASTDGSADGLDGLGLPLELVRNRVNAGFAAACNQGAAGSRADYLLFLNPDTRVFDDTLATTVDFMDSPAAADVGICGARVLLPDGRPAISCARFPTLRVTAGKLTGLARLAPRAFPPHHLPPEETAASRPVDQPIGAFFLVRRELFERLGGFDTRYFIYFEEVDLARRARDLGWQAWFLHEARVVHAENVSSDQVPDVRLYHSLRSRRLYARRHWPRAHARVLGALTFGVELPVRLARAAARRSRRELAATLAAYRRLLRELASRAGT